MELGLATAEVFDCGVDVELSKPERSSENLRLAVLEVTGLSPFPIAARFEVMTDVDRVDGLALDNTEDWTLDTTLDDEGAGVLVGASGKLIVGVIAIKEVDSNVIAGSVASGVPATLVKVTAGWTDWNTDGERGMTSSPVSAAWMDVACKFDDTEVIIDDDNNCTEVDNIVEVERLVGVVSLNASGLVTEADEVFANRGKLIL